ncbi:MAG: ATP-grasp domain-containing protein [Chloroflexota bacterium]|nr:ATP-grasp domain-containing protein [Chloroflexota bacterium]
MSAVLVANRGEVARRIFRTAKRLGLRTVAVFSDADAGAPFVREADTAIRIGPPEARESYLSIAAILTAAREAGAELVHPGYGFLAEDARFARAVVEAGLRFVGPSAEVLAALGDKAQAKGIAEDAGVPVLPGYRGGDQRDGAFIDAARTAGYPVMVKPTAGGGGIGMHLIEEEGGLRDALARARRAATAAFGDERLILERAVRSPRHVEVQILADGSGEVVTFAERDCSTQRRHQKVLEETPSPAVKPALRRRLRDAAATVARAAGYVNAGTVEFILDERHDFFFLEVNARLQVEHPVTEAAYDVDLVEWQLRIAQGEALPRAGFGEPRRAAIEVRVYAEDPGAGFLPSTGMLAHVRWPDGIRVDAGVEEGSAVTRHYDPLLGKLTAAGDDRPAALACLAEALDATELLGVRTNVTFLRALVSRPELNAGAMTTDFVELNLHELVQDTEEAPPQAIAVAAAALVAETLEAADPRDPWRALGPWRLASPPATTVVLRGAGGETAVTVEGPGPFEVLGLPVERGHGQVASVEGRGPLEAIGQRVQRGDKHHQWLVDGAVAAAARAGSVWYVFWRGDAHELDSAPRERSVAALAATEIVAPMPGIVLSVHATTEQRVRRGDLICIVEAMKMELRVEAPAEGIVKRVLCAAGDQVERGQRLAEFDPA